MHIGAGQLVTPLFLQPSSQSADGFLCPLDLLFGPFVLALHGQEQPAGTDKGQTQLTKDIHRRHRPGDSNVEFLPQLLLPGRFFRPPGHGLSQKPHGIAHFLQKIHPLFPAVQQQKPGAGPGDLQGNAGEPSPTAYINDPLAFKIPTGKLKQAVQHMTHGHLIRLGNSRQVHHLVFLQQQPGVFLQPFQSPFGQGNVPCETSLGDHIGKAHLISPFAPAKSSALRCPKD